MSNKARCDCFHDLGLHERYARLAERVGALESALEAIYTASQPDDYLLSRVTVDATTWDMAMKCRKET